MMLENKVAIVTGAGSGIGRASALRFAAEGAAVVVADVRAHKAESTVADIEAAGGVALASVTDVSDAAQVEAMVELAVRELGGLDVLFNNAGVSVPGTAADLATDDWNQVWHTNVSSLFHGAKFAIPHMTDRGGGSIVATASVSGLMADANNAAYAASKAAIFGLIRAIAVDHGRVGIRANCICPGITATPPMLYALGEGPMLEQAKDAVALGRLGAPDDLAAVAAFLASDESRFVTGQTIVADGGLTIESTFSRMMRM